MLCVQRLLRTWADVERTFTKQDHIGIVGGPGNGMVRSYHYSVEKDVNSIAERTANTNAVFMNLLKRHDKTWMNGKVRNVNLSLNWSFMGHGISHIGIIYTAAVPRNDCIAHGLHLNSQDKWRLMHLIVKRVSCGHTTNMSISPLIVHATASPFFSFKTLGQRC
jgi:hypothetical protein